MYMTDSFKWLKIFGLCLQFIDQEAVCKILLISMKAVGLYFGLTHNKIMFFRNL